MSKAQTIEVKLTINIEHMKGKFVTRQAVHDEIISILEDANPEEITIDDTEYTVVDWQAEIK
jgi:hypothetical protein